MKNLLYESDIDENTSVAIGSKAPDFKLKTQYGENWCLSENLGKVVTLLLYPKNETLVCTKQLCSLRENWQDYQETKAEIVGISPGTMSDHKKFGEKYRLPINLLADEDRRVTETYGFHWLFPTFFVRSIIVIDALGIIRSRRVMLRAFRPADRSVIREIYAAQADALQDAYKSLKRY